MNDTTLQLLTDPELVAARRAWEERLEHLADAPVYLQGRWGRGADIYEGAEQRVSEVLDSLAKHVESLRDSKVFRPLSVNSAFHGVHFVDKILGANVYELDGEKGNWQVEPLASDVGTLERPDLETNATWSAAREFARAFVASGVTVPVFMIPTIASALNVGLNLYGQELLMAMMTDPDAASHDLDVINSVLSDIHEWYRTNVPFDLLHQVACNGRYQPPGCGQICGCSTQLVSPDQYKKFIAERDDAILSQYPGGGMIHLCGTHTQHIGAWREMQSLKAVQLNDRAAEDLEIYMREMPEKIYYVNPCKGMPIERVEALAKTCRIVICAEPSGYTSDK